MMQNIDFTEIEKKVLEKITSTSKNDELGNTIAKIATRISVLAIVEYHQAIQKESDSNE